MPEQVKEKPKIPAVVRKASKLSFEAVYGADAERNIGRINAGYSPFRNYIKLATNAASLKKETEAEYDIVDRDNDYRLSIWLSIKVLDRKLNGSVLPYNEAYYDTLSNTPGITLEEIEVDTITVNGKEAAFHESDGTYYVECEGTDTVVVNNNPNLSIAKEIYVPTSVIYEGREYVSRKNKVSIDSFSSSTCRDSNLSFMEFTLSKDDNDQHEGEVTLELIDNPNNELSVYDVFFGEDATQVFFDNPDEKFSVPYKNKETGRIVVKVGDKAKDIKHHGFVHLNTNLIQLIRQRNAIETITTRPSKSQRNLLNLCFQYKFLPSLNPFNFKQQNLEYKILTDSTRDGTLVQRDFVQKAMQTPDFMILQGPPGSGKTTAILELIYQLALQGKKVLLCASTHVAIDNVLEKIIQHPNSKELLRVINPVRVGDENNICSDDVIPFIHKNIIEKVPEDYVEIVNNSFNLVCGTVIGVLQFPPIKTKIDDARGTSIETIFDYLILDEASKTTFSEFLVPAVLADRWVIVGDVKQLAPYVEKNDLVPSLLECEPLSKKEDRIALNLLRRFYNEKDSLRMRGRALSLPTSSIQYIDKKLPSELKIPIVAVTNKQLSRIYSVSENDLDNNSEKLVVLSTSGNIILIDSELVDKVLPYLNKHTVFIDYENNIFKEDLFKKYQLPRFRGAISRVDYNKEYDKYSRKIEEEILWRLIRLYELSGDQNANRNYKEYLEEVRKCFNDEEKAKFNSAVDVLSHIAIPSIIMMLQEGINRQSEFQTRLSAGLTPEEKQNRFVMLDYQHRMHPDISKIARENVYDGRALKDCSKWTSKMDYINNKSRFEIRPTKGSVVDSHNRNEYEAKAIINELVEFMEYAKKNPKKDNSKYEIAILTFYNGQVTLLRKELQKLFNIPKAKFNFYKDNVHVTLNSVDRFQGQEADVVYLSMVQTNRVGFLDSISRLNVAITRAKEKIVIFGDKDFFINQEHSTLLQKLFKEAK